MWTEVAFPDFSLPEYFLQTQCVSLLHAYMILTRFFSSFSSFESDMLLSPSA